MKESGGNFFKNNWAKSSFVNADVWAVRSTTGLREGGGGFFIVVTCRLNPFFFTKEKK